MKLYYIAILSLFIGITFQKTFLFAMDSEDALALPKSMGRKLKHPRKDDKSFDTLSTDISEDIMEHSRSKILLALFMGDEECEKNPVKAMQMLSKLELYGDEKTRSLYKGAMIRSLIAVYSDPKKIQIAPTSTPLTDVVLYLEANVTDTVAYNVLKQETKRLINKAAEEGNPSALNILVEGMSVGFIWEHNPTRASELNTKLAIQGDKRARKRMIKGLLQGKIRYKKDELQAKRLSAEWGLAGVLEKHDYSETEKEIDAIELTIRDNAKDFGIPLQMDKKQYKTGS